MIKQLLAASLVAASFGASATLTPTYTTFGALPAATFGGSGIPNGAVAITTLNPTAGVVTMGLTAHSRYFNLPPVSNDGAGHFFATTGIDPTSPTSISAQYAKWNFAFYIGGDAAAVAQYSYELFMDVDPTAGETFKTFGAGAGPGQDSWNLGFNGFESALGYSFNPSVDGEYSFRLVARNQAGAIVGETSMVVEVPEPASLALAGVALLAAGAVRRRKA